MSKVGKLLDRISRTETEKRRVKEKQREKLYDLAADAGMTYATRGTNKMAQSAPKKAKGGTMAKKENFIQEAVKEMDKKGTKGAFTKKAERRDMSVKQFTNEVLDNPSKYDLKTRRQAQFVKNITDYGHGGQVEKNVSLMLSERDLGNITFLLMTKAEEFKKDSEGYDYFQNLATKFFEKSYRMTKRKEEGGEIEFAKGGKIGVGAYILRLYDDAYDKVIENGYNSMQEYLDELDERGIGYAELDEGYGGEEDAIYTHSEEVVEELSNDGIAYQTYSSRFDKGGEVGKYKYNIYYYDEEYAMTNGASGEKSFVSDFRSDEPNLDKIYWDSNPNLQREKLGYVLNDGYYIEKNYAKGGTMGKSKFEIIKQFVEEDFHEVKEIYRDEVRNNSSGQELSKGMLIALRDTLKDIKNIEKGIYDRKMAKGGIMKKQGFDDKLDESVSMRKGKESSMKQSFKDRRDESKGMEKAMGRRAYASVGTMDKGRRMMAKGGEIKIGKVNFLPSRKNDFNIVVPEGKFRLIREKGFGIPTEINGGKLTNYKNVKVEDSQIVSKYQNEIQEYLNKEMDLVYAKGGQLDSVSGTKKHFGISESKWSKMSAAKKKELRKLSQEDLEAGRKYRQGYNDKLDESLGNTDGKESTKKQSLKDRRDESKGEEKALGRRAYSSVKTMDKMLPFLSWHKK